MRGGLIREEDLRGCIREEDLRGLNTEEVLLGRDSLQFPQTPCCRHLNFKPVLIFFKFLGHFSSVQYPLNV